MKPSELLYLDSRSSTTSASLLGCPNGIPFGWVILFGGRNYWEPDQPIEERGGVSAERDQLITPIEVSQPRLQNAIDAFKQAPHLWPWVSSLEVLNKRLKTRSRKGFLKLHVPWLSSDQLHELNKSTAYMENTVYQINSGNLDVSKLLAQFEGLCPWTPLSIEADAKRFEARTKEFRKPNSVLTLGELIIGSPEQHNDRFESQLEEVCVNPFNSSFQFAPYPVYAEASTASKGQNGSHDSEGQQEKSSSFFSRLFSRK